MKDCTTDVPESQVPKVMDAYWLSVPKPTSVTMTKQEGTQLYTVCAEFPDA